MTCSVTPLIAPRFNSAAFGYPAAGTKKRRHIIVVHREEQHLVSNVGECSSSRPCFLWQVLQLCTHLILQVSRQHSK